MPWMDVIGIWCRYATGGDATNTMPNQTGHSFNIVNRRIGSIFFGYSWGMVYKFVYNTSKRENMYNLGMVMQSGRVFLPHFLAWIKSKGSWGAIRPSMGV